MMWTWNRAMAKDEIREAMCVAGWLDFSYANLRGANLSGAYLRAAYLHNADLRGANLRGADLNYANLSYANLSYANLSYANLRGANLRGADLRGADLIGADLHSADLRGAYLDFSCLPLWCGGLLWRIDRKQLSQLAYHICSMVVNPEDAPEWSDIRESLLPLANEMHRSDVPRLKGGA